MKYSVIPSMVFGLFLLAPILASAQPERGGRLRKAVENLDPAKREQARKVFDRERPKLKALRESLRERRQALQEVSQGEKFDERAVRAAAMKVAEVQAEMMVLRMKMMREAGVDLKQEQPDWHE